MLDSLTLFNFQAHRKLRIKLSPTVTTITGRSDSGKSSVIRALYWLTFNRPLGTHFIHKDEDHCKVSARVDGIKLVRERGEGINQYTLNSKIYKALGQDIPEDVSAFLNFGPENFQRQHDPHFWLSLSPGELAKELNKIVSLELIDQVNHKLASWVRSHKSRITFCQERLDSARKRVETLSWVEQAHRDLCILEDKRTVIDEKASKIDSAGRLVEEGGFIKERVQTLSESIIDGRNVVSRGESLLILQKRYDSLYNLTSKLRETCREVTKTRESLEKAQKELNKVRTCPLCGASTSKLCS